MHVNEDKQSFYYYYHFIIIFIFPTPNLPYIKPTLKQVFTLFSMVIIIIIIVIIIIIIIIIQCTNFDKVYSTV